jgi:hypothetical protein
LLEELLKRAARREEASLFGEAVMAVRVDSALPGQHLILEKGLVSKAAFSRPDWASVGAEKPSKRIGQLS